MIAMNDFNFQTFVFITLILRIKSEQTTCPVCPPGSGLSLTKDDDPCHCRQCHSREYTRSSDNTCVPCDPSSCEDSMKRHTVSPCKPDANVVCGPCLSGYDEPGYGDPSEPCRKIDDNFPGVSHGPISTNIYEEPGNEATSSEPFQDIVEVFPKHNNDFIAIIGVIVLTAVIAWLVCKNVKKCLEKQCRFQYPFRYGSNLSATRVHAQASSDDELTHVTTGLLPHDQSSTATSVTHASPSYLGMDNLPSQASFTNVSVPPDDVGTGAPRQSNGAIVTVPPAADNSAPRLPNSSTVDQQPDTDNSSSPAMSNGSTETEQPGIGNSTPTLQHGTAIDHQHDANNSTRKQTLLSTEVTEQQRTERRQSEEQSCLHQSASVASRIDDASTCPPAAASAEALVANAGSEQPTADDTLKLKRREDTDMMSVASSMATRRQESQKTESDKDGNDQAQASTDQQRQQKDCRRTSTRSEHDTSIASSQQHSDITMSKGNDNLPAMVHKTHRYLVQRWLHAWSEKLRENSVFFLKHLQLTHLILAHCTSLMLITSSDCNMIEASNLREPQAIKQFLALMKAMYPHSIQDVAKTLDEEQQKPMASVLNRLIDEVLIEIDATLDDFKELQYDESCVPPVRTQVS